MVPSTAQGSKQILQGVIKAFDAQKGFGFITADGGQQYFFHANNARMLQEQGGNVNFDEERDNRNPLPGDRVFFIHTPPRKRGERPQAMPWGFRDPEPRASIQAQRMGLPMAPSSSLAPTTTQETIDELIKRQSEGSMGVMVGLVSLQAETSEAAVRVLCEFAPKGGDLWLDFKKRQAESGNARYGWKDYLMAIVTENADKLMGPKSCILQPMFLRRHVWMEAFRLGGRGTDAELFGLYLEEPAVMTKYGSACKGCNERQCKFYKKSDKRSERR